jgi:hypothetical protein
MLDTKEKKKLNFEGPYNMSHKIILHNIIKCHGTCFSFLGCYLERPGLGMQVGSPSLVSYHPSKVRNKG